MSDLKHALMHRLFCHGMILLLWQTDSLAVFLQETRQEETQYNVWGTFPPRMATFQRHRKELSVYGIIRYTFCTSKHSLVV